MDILLISRDGDLYRLCREILSEFSTGDWQLSVDTGVTSLADADLYIWDGAPSSQVAEKLNPRESLSKHLFLIQRNDLVAFHHKIQAADTNILLKPVTRATLTAFLNLAISVHAAGPFSNPNSLRADRDKILQCLIQANLKLQEYDQDRTNFLTRAVHDFRAPLTAVSGYCGLLLNEALGPLTEDQREVLERMQHSTKRLSRMASAMFQLSVGRHIKKQPELTKGDIRESIEQAMHEVAPFLEGKRISISAQFEPETGIVYFESGQMEQVFINLLDNACKFTPRDGEIDIQGYPYFWERRMARMTTVPAKERRERDLREYNSYRIDIRDSGPPIPPDHLDSIFEEYTSYSGGQDRSGGGLGLAICRMIATLHEGSIWAENVDNGPRFSLVLPVHSVRPGLRHKEELFAFTETR